MIYIQVALRVAEGLKTFISGSEEISKIQENLKTCWNYKVVLSIPAKMKIFSILGKYS